MGRRDAIWIALVIIAAAFLSRPSPQADGPLNINGVAPGMSQAEVEKLLGPPLSVGLTKTDNLVNESLLVADYRDQATVYYNHERKAINVRGSNLGDLARAGELRSRVQERLGAPDHGAAPVCFCIGCLPQSLVYADRRLEVYLKYRGDSRKGWEKATVDYFELGARI